MPLLELVSLLAATAHAAQPASTATQPASGPIVVTGERVPPGGSPNTSHVEDPYPETERVPLGSRIPRRSERRPFNTIATDSGVAGLIAAPGLNFDAAGGAFQNVRNRRVTQCVARNAQVSEATACALFRVRRHIEAGELNQAAALLDPLLARRTLSAIDRFYVASYSYQLGEAANDNARRESALTAMIESGRMAPADRNAAMRVLARLSAQRGDDGTAIARLERLIAEMPDDPRNHADLAWLYARTGRDREALPRMARAVELARQSGRAVPQAWLDFLNADP